MDWRFCYRDDSVSVNRYSPWLGLTDSERPLRISRQDFRLAARSFTRHPGFTSVAILSLALAIALNTTMYSVIDALVSPKVEMRDPGQLYHLMIWGDTRHIVDQATRASLLATATEIFEETTSGGGTAQEAAEYKRRFQMAISETVASTYFDVLGVRPTAGRLFTASDANGDGAPVVVSEGLVATLFPGGGSPLGQVIDVNGVPHSIIGVIGPTSQFPGEHIDIWKLPASSASLSPSPPSIYRLKKGLSAVVADKQLHALSGRFAALANESPKDAWFQLVPATVPQFHYRGFHIALIAAVVAVLLIACANLANLQLARGIGRSRELALRAALGASRRDIITQLVVESAMLAAAGLVAGLVLTFWGIHILSSRIPPSVAEYVIAPQTSWRVFAFAVTAGVVCVMLVGLLPAIRVSRVDPNELLKAGAGTGASKKNRRQYGVLVAVEISLSLALLSGAGVVVQSAIAMTKMKPGYDMRPLTTAFILHRSPRDTVLRYIDVANQLVTRTRALPDVADASVWFSNQTNNDTVLVYDADGNARHIPTPLYSYLIVSPSYMRTMGLSIAKGRDFIEGVPSEPEVIIDQQTAKFLWHDADPIGRQIKLGDSKSQVPWVRVVGVLRPSDDMNKLDVYGNSIEGAALQEKASRIGRVYYLPTARDSIVRRRNSARAFFLVARAKSEPERMPITLRRNFQNMEPFRLLYAEKMDVFLRIRQLQESHDFVAATFVSFASLALALAALGIYGIVAYSVAERRREIGVRLALGATSGNILHVVLREGNALALAGVAVGLIFTRFSVPLLAAFSFEGDQYNAPLFAAMAVLLFAVAVTAALIPGWRATRIDPVESLRNE
jgi:putative ABC transport system permease protein